MAAKKFEAEALYKVTVKRSVRLDDLSIMTLRPKRNYRLKGKLVAQIPSADLAEAKKE